MENYSATYLPEVCHEQGWTRDQCIDSLIRKAGYRGSIDSSFRSNLKVTRYQSTKYSLNYSEYEQIKSSN